MKLPAPGVAKSSASAKAKKPSTHHPTTPKQISASQRSYYNQAAFFDKFITFILNQPTYIPNEIELQEASHHDFSTQLHAANKATDLSDTPWLNALSARDIIFYTPTTGLVDRALAVKKYVHSVKTITPEDYSQISGLIFTRPNKR